MLRSVLVLACAILLIGLLGPVGLLGAWLSRSARPLFALAVPATRALFWLAGVRLEVTGHEHLEPNQSYLFVGNHVSNLDPPVAMVAIGRDVRALAKAELFRIPVFGQVLRAAGFAPVDRRDRNRAVEALDVAAGALARGTDFLAFPEGTRSRDGQLQPFKKGPFVMAIKAQAPLAPFVLRNTRSLWPRGAWRVRPGTVTVEFLTPVSTAGLAIEDRDDLRDRVHRSMSAALAAEPRTLTAGASTVLQ